MKTNISKSHFSHVIFKKHVRIFLSTAGLFLQADIFICIYRYENTHTRAHTHVCARPQACTKNKHPLCFETAITLLR